VSLVVFARVDDFGILGLFLALLMVGGEAGVEIYLLRTLISFTDWQFR